MFWKNNSSYEDVAVIEYMDALYSYAMGLTRNRSEAEDLVQETYLRAMRVMRRLRASSNIKSWLLVILHNIWLNQLRRQRTTPMVVEIDVGRYHRKCRCGDFERLPRTLCEQAGVRAGA
jgi:RNA polymerase sigma-70 factor (ECF subfamily)